MCGVVAGLRQQLVGAQALLGLFPAQALMSQQRIAELEADNKRLCQENTRLREGSGWREATACWSGWPVSGRTVVRAVQERRSVGLLGGLRRCFGGLEASGQDLFDGAVGPIASIEGLAAGQVPTARCRVARPVPTRPGRRVGDLKANFDRACLTGSPADLDDPEVLLPPRPCSDRVPQLSALPGAEISK